LLIGFLSGLSSSAFAMGPAFSGIAAKADTAETVYLNPAGMTRLTRPSWYGNPMIMYTESNTEVTIENEGVQGKRKLEEDGVMLLPGIYYSRPVNNSWYIGIGPNAASGIGASYGNEWVGRYIVDEWSTFMVGVAPSAAYRVNDKLSLGGSLSVNYSQFNLNKAVFNGPDETDGDFELKANGFAFGFTLGMLYECTPQTRFGIVYRSELAATNEGEPDFSGLSQQRRDLLDQAGVLNQEISVDTNQPQAFIAGVFHDFSNGWTMTLDALWLDFSEWNIDNVEIGDTTITKDSTDYQDIWGCTLGATYDWKPKWTLRGGVLYVSSAVEDEDRTLFTRYDAIWGIGFGIEHQFSKQRRVAVDINYLQFGDGEFAIEDAPVVGNIMGKYDKHYGLALSISITR
jgi:long-chain fatty acid transport protein